MGSQRALDMFKSNFILGISVLVVLLVSCGAPELSESVKLAYGNLPEEVDFNQHVKPILSDKCFICHGPDKGKIKAGLQLHLPDLAYAELKDSPGKYAIVPGNLKKSEVVHRILTSNPERIMPMPDSHLSLTDYEKAMLVKWIEEGAVYKDHWAFIPPKKTPIPKVESIDKVANPIDNFILARLEKEGLASSPRANREILLRRLSLDLTGLPPTLEEMESFLKDDSPQAYEKQVDRLLASSHFGEQLTLDWMDLSRFADTHGYTVDRYRDISPWRDWVIKAFNENMPYDQFLRWQLAGDMMPNASKEQILATTFSRLHPQNGEGGIIDEEFRSEYVSDRTNILGEGLMGLTMACAKCHDHKYDPITQKEYYEMYSFFNNVNESGQISFDWAMPVPTLLLPTDEQKKFLTYVDNLINDKEQKLNAITDVEVKLAKDWIKSKDYKTNFIPKIQHGLIAQMDFNSGQLDNQVYPFQKGLLRRQHAGKQKPLFVNGYDGTGLELDGDAWLDMVGLGIFQRNQPFSIGVHIKIPEDLENGVIFHKGQGAKLYNFRGYHLALKDNKLEVLLAHIHPDNAIVEHTLEDVPKEKWIQLTMSYDGSSKAYGLKLYLDGVELVTKIVIDNLYKDIVFNSKAHTLRGVPKDPGLQIGARWRGKGIGGAIVDNILVFEKELTTLEVLQIAEPGSLEKLQSKKQEELSENEREDLVEYFLSVKSEKYQHALEELKETRKTMVDSMDGIKEIMVMKEMTEPRETFVLERGQYDMFGERVYPNTPERIFAFPDSLPQNRLGLAQWLTQKDHPLTARVAVNRYWQNIFGTGIVRTSEDFGNQGEMPSHMALLDWLAIEFTEAGWDVRALHKLMVMSKTYQQSSLASDELLEHDKENRLLARGPSERLTGEMLRNNVLVASGLMNYTIGGKSVKPYQPNGLWKINGATYQPDKGEKLYRKSMYTLWKRSVPHPTMATFDAPERSFCAVRRQETNTPLQALVMLNDPTYVEASRVLGSSMLAYSDSKEGISNIFKRLTGRNILEKELQLLMEMRQNEYKKFTADLSKTRGWLNSGEFRVSRQQDAAQIAANAVVASTIINSDATITKR